MTTIKSWDNKTTSKVLLPEEIKTKYFSKENYSLIDVENIFIKSYKDFKDEELRIDYFSEISSILWGILIKIKEENSEAGKVILLTSDINFYLNSNNFDMVDDFLDEAEEFVKSRKLN